MTEVAVTLVNVPQPTPEQPEPRRLHVTPWFCVSFVKVAEKFAEVLICSDAVAGATETEITGAAKTVMVAEAVLLVLATDFAVSLTVEFGGVAGAL